MMLALLIAFAAPQETIGPPVPAAASAETLAISFDPPTDRTLRYRKIRNVQVAGNRHRIEFIHASRFEPTLEGYRLWVELESVEVDPATSMAIRAAAMPMVGVRYASLLTDNGTPTGIADQPAVWNHTLEGLERIRISIDSGALETGTHRAIANMILARFREMGPDEQLAMLAGARSLWETETHLRSSTCSWS